jgi:HD-GYP domain-containing protein (c-di-GMP phosphodiesterase class II)
MSTKNFLIHTKKYKLIVSAVHMVYRLVNSTYNAQELILRLTRLLCQFIKADASTIILINPKTKKPILKAIFNNQINILINTKQALAKITPAEKKILDGFTLFEKHMIGLPLVADDNIGAIFVERKQNEKAFVEFDKEILSVVAEQSVTAIRNLQLSEEQQKTILGSIEFIGKLLKRYRNQKTKMDAPAYFKILRGLGMKLNLGEDVIDSLYYASVLRDAGAIDVPYEILSKKSQLTPEEFKIVRTQPERSAALIRPVKFLKPVLPIVLYHHEKYDGTGYPSGLRREQIPIGARILSVVDAFEAMTKDRPYKSRLTIHQAIKELQKNSGTQFDPAIVDAFITLFKQKKFRYYLS